ncbi:hypothetical protein ABLE68_18320 [Nocardioides sp. CN2-186]|uniref:hypothetical protein n=1 Tax=Nocardioides tweenelious TaxID=3156607 RepID=UPI0032B43A3D
MVTPSISTRLALTACAVITASSLLVATNSTTGATTSASLAPAAQPLDPEVILPSRVDAALTRVLDSLGRANAEVDDRNPTAAAKALTATGLNVVRATLATVRQMDAAPPPDTEAETTAGPDSALATLNVDQVVITEVAGLFDRVTNTTTIAALVQTLSTGLDRRASLLTKVLALDPEGAGAPYADGLVDTVPGYTDEVANLTEALADDHLTATSRAALKDALAKSKADEARVLAAFPVED